MLCYGKIQEHGQVEEGEGKERKKEEEKGEGTQHGDDGQTGQGREQTHGRRGARC